MKKQFLFCIVSFFALYAAAQTYTIGTQTITYTDPARSNRAVGVDFRYPGTNGALASGQFPFVVFAHGFSMDQTPYYPYADSLAKRGYIVGLLTTETGLSPSHANFAQDLLFVYNKLISEGSSNNASPFYNKVVAKGAIGGHSMGGGSTVLSAQYGNPQACSFTFAAATTNPSSITAAHLMTKPYLSFAGSSDCIAPIATHQQPMYDSSGSSCKFLINITNGLHCQYGNANTACSFGEGFSGCASSPLTRQQQIDKTLYHLIPFLDYYLKGDCNAWTLFENRYTANTVDVKQRNCTNTVPSNASIAGSLNFCSGNSTMLVANPTGFQYLWSDNSTGGMIHAGTAGNYSVVVGNGTCSLPAVSVTVTENFSPTTPSAITSADTVCSNIPNINISVTNDPAVTAYDWTMPSGWSVTAGNNTNSIQVTSGTTGGTISVMAINGCGVTAPVTETITVIPSNLGTPGLITGTDTTCAGQILQFSIAPVSGANSYEWNFPLGWTPGAPFDSTDIAATTNSTGGNVGVVAVNECGQSLPSYFNVTVNIPPMLAGDIAGPDTICNGGGIGTYYTLNPFPAGNDNYNWSVPNDWSFVDSSNLAAPIINVNSSGAITVNTSNSCGNSSTISLNVVLVDTPNAQITATGNTFTASPVGAGYTFIWYLDGQIIQSANNNTYIPTESGNYSVVITNDNFCRGSSAQTNFIYNGIDETDAEVFSVSPNPNATGSLHVVTGSSLIGAELKIFDLTGKLIHQSLITNHQSSINTAPYSKGVYLISIEKTGTTLRTKLVVE